jgi:hypothetical protein
MTNRPCGAISVPPSNPVPLTALQRLALAKLRHRDDIIAVEDAHRAQQVRTPQSQSVIRMPPDVSR